MSKNVRFCEYCHSNPQPFGGLGGIGYSTYLDENEYECQNCGNKVKDLPLLVDEYDVLIEISTDESFIQAMIDLKEKDIIEFNLKMSQFKTQLNQQESSRVQTDIRPKCPHCHSTNIKSISGLERTGSIVMWGIFSKKINKSFKCEHCGYTW